jgi:hypothetical protein
MTAPLPSAGRRPPMPQSRYRALVAVAVGLALLAIVLGVRATRTGSEDPITVSGRPEVVEHLIPGSGDEVVQQFEVGIDLAPGFEASLIINGIEIPEEQARIVAEQNQVFFQPGEGKVITELLAGQNCAAATVWRSAVGRGDADEIFQWCFEAT